LKNGVAGSTEALFLALKSIPVGDGDALNIALDTTTNALRAAEGSAAFGGNARKVVPRATGTREHFNTELLNARSKDTTGTSTFRIFFGHDEEGRMDSNVWNYFILKRSGRSLG
jgi:hypothetical protein